MAQAQVGTFSMQTALGGDAAAATDRVAPDFLPFRQQIQAIGRQFHSRGWSLATSSNYSAVVGRDPLRLLITASGKHKGELTLEDFVLVNAVGQNVAGTARPSAETLLHCVLAEKLPNVGAVLHTHSVWGTLLSDRHFPAGRLDICGYEMQKGLEGVTTHEQPISIRIFENSQDIPALAAQLAVELAAGEPSLQYGFLLRRHGLYTWGKDLSAARRHVETLEFLFEVTARAAGMTC
ncbi:MAG: methylthioribulose 1-phosphate dehydratase [Pirellulales bacterium]|nr:methylthioribulose 1-phosphate dehydratase [Pirellulales bacterium]